MTEEAQKPAAAETPAPSEEVTVVADVPLAPEKEAPPVPEPEPEVAEKAAAPAASGEEVVEAEAEKPKTVVEEEKAIEKAVAQSVSFKEESYVVSELPEAHRKALDELRQLVQEALNKHEFTAPPETKKEEKKEEEKKEKEKKEEDKKEEEKKEEVKAEEKTEEKAEVKSEEKAEVKSEEKTEEKTEERAEEKKIEEKTEEKTEKCPKTEEVAETVVVEKVTAVVVVDEDGAKTVEAIEESVVVATEEAAAPSTKAGEEEPKKAEEEKEAAATTATETAAPEAAPVEPEDVYIWGIPLLRDERNDVILLKFLRARDYKVKDAFAMIKNTVRWRKDFGIDSLIDEDLGSDWDKVVFTHGVDKEGHPVCYNVFGEFSNKELYQNTFGDEEKRSKFIKWRIQFLEKSIRKFDFNPTGISTIVQVNDLKSSPGLFKREHHQVTNQALNLLQDNYPEFVARQVII